MQTMTYGVLPSREAFNAAFEVECPAGYRLILCGADSGACEQFKLGTGVWSADELWDAITEIITTSQAAPPDTDQSAYYMRLDGAMDVVSAIMGTLGFEWI